MREIYGFLRLLQVLVLQTCVDLRVRLARALQQVYIHAIHVCVCQSLRVVECVLVVANLT